MESYQAFLKRINGFEKKEISFEDAAFRVNASLAQKVDQLNRFCLFFGDTVVFDLEETTKKELDGIIKRLYAAAPECFCERLASHTLHMTLHDLSSGPPLENTADELCENERKVRQLAEKLSNYRIKMRSKAIFNMVNTSLVLGLYPVNEEEYRKLAGLYTLLEKVKQLDYPFTPHITLAYFSRNGFEAASARKLEKIVRQLNEADMKIELDTGKLFYQKFSSMNAYTNILNLGEAERHPVGE